MLHRNGSCGHTSISYMFSFFFFGFLLLFFCSVVLFQYLRKRWNRIERKQHAKITEQTKDLLHRHSWCLHKMYVCVAIVIEHDVLSVSILSFVCFLYCFSVFLFSSWIFDLIMSSMIAVCVCVCVFIFIISCVGHQEQQWATSQKIGNIFMCMYACIYPSINPFLRLYT